MLPIGAPVASSTQRLLGQPPPAGMLGQPRKYTPPIWGRTSSADRINPENPPSSSMLYQVKRMEADARALPHHLAAITAAVESLKRANLKGMVEVADYIRDKIPSNDGLANSVSNLAGKIDQLSSGLDKNLKEVIGAKSRELVAAVTSRLESEQAESGVRHTQVIEKLDLVLEAFQKMADDAKAAAAPKDTKDAWIQTEPPFTACTVVVESQETLSPPHKTSEVLLDASLDLLQQQVPQVSPVKSAPEPDQETMYPSPIPVRHRDGGFAFPAFASTPKRLEEEEGSAGTTFLGSQAAARRGKSRSKESSSVLQLSVRPQTSKRQSKWQQDLESSFQSSLYKPQLPKQDASDKLPKDQTSRRVPDPSLKSFGGKSQHKLRKTAKDQLPMQQKMQEATDSSFQSSVFAAKPQVPKGKGKNVPSTIGNDKMVAKRYKLQGAATDSSFQSSVFSSKPKPPKPRFQLPVRRMRHQEATDSSFQSSIFGTKPPQPNHKIKPSPEADSKLTKLPKTRLQAKIFKTPKVTQDQKRRARSLVR